MTPAETLALLLVGAGLVCAALALVARAERKRMEQEATRRRASGADEGSRSRLMSAQDDVTNLLRFKAYVHARLDDAGIPTHPEGPHSQAGCRIGDRLDILIAERDAALEWIGVVRDELVAAGGSNGDRDAALKNLRALITNSRPEFHRLPGA